MERVDGRARQEALNWRCCCSQRLRSAGLMCVKSGMFLKRMSSYRSFMACDGLAMPVDLGFLIQASLMEGMVRGRCNPASAVVELQCPSARPRLQVSERRSSATCLF